MPPTSRDFVGENETDFQARLQHLQSKAFDVPISFCLPKANAVAGAVLEHAIKVIERTFSKQDPCIFKVGFTHNPVFRWCNGTYGYAHSVEKWSNMTVFYASPEPFSAAMLESALIEKYRSISAASSGNLIVYLFGILFARVFYHAIFAHIYTYLWWSRHDLNPANVMRCSMAEVSLVAEMSARVATTWPPTWLVCSCAMWSSDHSNTNLSSSMMFHWIMHACMQPCKSWKGGHIRLSSVFASKRSGLTCI